MEIFNLPVLNYGSEVCIIDSLTSKRQIETVQMKVGKRLLGVSRVMYNEMVRGELGWTSMMSRRDMMVLRFFGRLVNMRDSRVVRKVFFTEEE